MKYLVLLFFTSMGYSHPEHDPSNITYPVFFFNGYEVDDPTFDITDIGTDHNHALECRTDLDTCCGMNQGFHRGNWYSPNGQQLEVHTSIDRNSVYQSRLDSKVNLYRDGDFGVREGDYCCKIETVAVHRNEKGDDYHVETKCIKLVNYTKDCPALAIENGAVHITGSGHGSTATFTCNRGYNLIGESNLTCKARSWNKDPPICEDSCIPEGKIWNGCGTACPVTCDNYGTVIPCITQCVAGCFCPDGTVEYNGKCLPPNECPDWCPKPDLCGGTVSVTGDTWGDIISYTCDDGFEPVGPTLGVCQENRKWSIRPRCRGCLTKLYIMAFTSTVPGGGSDRHHDLFISFRNGSNMTISFFNRQGDDMATNKGDLWTFVLSDYNLHCLSYHDFKKLAIVQSNTDTWHIESIASILKGNACKGPRYYPLTIDMEVNHWIGPRYESLNLTEADSCRWRY